MGMRDPDRRVGRSLALILLAAVMLTVCGTADARTPVWRQYDAPSVLDRENRLSNLVRVPGTRQLWAIGTSYPSGASTGYRTLAMRYNGRRWRIRTAPAPPGAYQETLSSIVAVSRREMWAVGSYNDGLFEPLVVHYRSGRWSTMTVPFHDQASLAAVAAKSPDDVWAVGWTGPPAGRHVQMLSHWDGSTWRTFPGPEIPGHATVEAVAITAIPGTKSLIAVGTITTGSRSRALVERYTRHAWRRMPAPKRTWALDAVAAHGRKDIMVVGAGPTGTAASHWDGRAWIRAEIDHPKNRFPEPDGPRLASIPGTHGYWLVGIRIPGSHNNHTLLERYSRRHGWRTVSFPEPRAYLAQTTGIAAVSKKNAWTVGWRVGRLHHVKTYVNHYR
jgi:hypothetical protein